MIRDENPAGFTVDSKTVFLAIFVLAFSAREREVNGEALEWASSVLCRIFASRFFSLFGTNERWTLLNDGIKVLELRNTIDKFMSRMQPIIGRMSKTLVPQNIELSPFRDNNGSRALERLDGVSQQW